MNSEEIIQLSSEGDACIRIQRLLVEKKNFLEHLFELRKITSKLTQLSGQLQTNAKNNDSVVAETEESSLSLLRKRKEQLEQELHRKDSILRALVDRLRQLQFDLDAIKSID
jgi:uncharacterized protein YjcR